MRHGALGRDPILRRGQEWPEKQETFPGEVPKGRQQKMPIRLYALGVEKSYWWRFLRRESPFFAWIVTTNERKK
jgi:hypothetical protein